MLRFFRLGFSFRVRVRGRVCLVASTSSTIPSLAEGPGGPYERILGAPGWCLRSF